MDINALRERPSVGSMTVSELNGFIKNMFDGNRLLASVTVKGEISNFTNHRSGHLYFSLKDADGQIRAVMFRSSAIGLKFMPENGMKVIVHGSVSVYTRDGSYQLYVNSMQPDGLGALYLAYEQLKNRLESEGLFDSYHKKNIPEYPRKIGVITSPTGAAVHDIINVIGRRYPIAEIYLYPALVQGDGAEDSLCCALNYFNRSSLVDTVIIGRGGGSIEDLWAFNSERLARLIFSSDVPIISAVGHETDFTICDFVADMRAPTPSAAAELAVPDIRELALRIDNYSTRLDRALLGLAESCRARLEAIESKEVFANPQSVLSKWYETVADVRESLDSALSKVITDMKSRATLAIGKLEALSPLAVLSRGYSVVENNGRIVDSVKKVKSGETVTIRLTDGTLSAKLED